MSIITSLYTGASGLGAHGDAIGVVGDNIANASTVGFRASRASFQDVIGGQALSGQRLGAGVRSGGPETLFGQGSLQQTGGALDLAIRGGGFFAVKGAHQGVDGSYYTRDGRFHVDNEGRVVNPENLKLQGFTVDASGKMGSSAGDIVLTGQNGAPKATSAVEMRLNLDATAAAPTAPWDPANPAATSSFATSTTVFDSLGGEHRVDLYFRPTTAGAWEWHGMADGGELTGGTAGTPAEIATGTMSFNSAGALDVETPGAASADFLGAQAGQALSFDFGDAITTDGGTGLAGTTQFATASAVNGVDQDGFAPGTLTDVSVGDDGTITGMFSNGQSRAVGQVALAHFASDAGLHRAGNQLFTETRDSGQAVVGAPGTGGAGSISSASLESSNVDLGSELVTLIAYQRAFQANARTVTTADEMLAEISNLKR